MQLTILTTAGQKHPSNYDVLSTCLCLSKFGLGLQVCILSDLRAQALAAAAACWPHS